MENTHTVGIAFGCLMDRPNDLRYNFTTKQVFWDGILIGYGSFNKKNFKIKISN